MTNPQHVVEVYASVIKDLCAWHPLLDNDDFSPHLERLKHLMETRGIRVVQEDLPTFGKLIDKGLSSGYLQIADIPHSLGSWNDSTVLFYPLLSEVFRRNGTLSAHPADIDPNTVFFVRQLMYMMKRAKHTCSEATNRQAWEEFVAVDRGLRMPHLSWGCTDLYGSDDYLHQFFASRRLAFHSDGTVPQTWLDILQLVFDYYTPAKECVPSQIVPRHGPGAVADVRTGDDKFDFPVWPTKLGRLFPWEQFAFHREGPLPLHKAPLDHPLSGGTMAGDIPSQSEPSPYEVPARLIDVPKTIKGPRLITVEPTAHQYIQQGVLRWLRENMLPTHRRSVTFTSQEPSRVDALRASRTGMRATIDLSSASDRLSCYVVERAFRANPGLLCILNACRTDMVRDMIGDAPSECIMHLRKFAGMGSAVTFPVQSMIYSCVAATAVLIDRKWVARPRNYRRAMGECRVFGDDIILPSSSVDILARLLNFLELKVNYTKSHFEGHFRESCGMDAWYGHPVTPVYLTSFELDETPEGFAGWVEVTNNAHIGGLWHLSAFLTSRIPAKVQRGIPISRWDLESLSLRTFLYGTVFRGKVRESEQLHRTEGKALMIRAKPKMRRRESWQSLLQYFLEQPQPETKWSSGWITRKSVVLTTGWVFLPSPAKCR